MNTTTNDRTSKARKALTAWHHDHTGETPEPSPSDFLRAFASLGWAGHGRTVRCVSPGMLTGDHTGMYNGSHYCRRTVGTWVEEQSTRRGRREEPFTYARLNVQRIEVIDTAPAAALLRRYLDFCRHMTEVAPGWVPTSCVHWADNSIEVTDTATDGRSRIRTVLGAGEFYSNSGCECQTINDAR